MTCGASPRDHHPVRIRRQRLSETLFIARPLPRFEVRIRPPNLSEWQRGNTGIRGVMQFDSNRVGPHAVLVSLMHGNEFAGAIALDRIIRQGVNPRSGTVSFVFANLDAFARFDPDAPTASRFIDEDMNRVWNSDRLNGTQSSLELNRARELLPVLQSADILLDLHSMLWDSEPLLIAPGTRRSSALAASLAGSSGMPRLIVTDLGHLGGSRLIEQSRFIRAGGPARSVLLEAGQHWQADTIATSLHVAQRLLDNAEAIHLDAMDVGVIHPEQAIVTDNVMARSAAFTFAHPFRGGDIVQRAGTVIARDGDDEICTPYDGCLLVMPNHRARRGQLAVRLARLIGEDPPPRQAPG